jgi:hypothetical protein
LQPLPDFRFNISEGKAQGEKTEEREGQGKKG